MLYMRHLLQYRAVTNSRGTRALAIEIYGGDAVKNAVSRLAR